MTTLDTTQPFSVNEALTNVKIHNLFDQTVINNFVRADFNNTASPIHIAATEPTAGPVPIAGHVWFDTVNALLRVYDGAVWQPWSRGYSYTNKSGSSVSTGNVVILDTSNASAVTKTTVASSADVFGVVLVGGADNASIIVSTEGFVGAVDVKAATAIGDFLSTSTTSGSCAAASTISQGAFARALTSTAGSGQVACQVGGSALAANAAGFKWAAMDVNSFTRSTLSTGNQTITHSLGVVPKFILTGMVLTTGQGTNPNGYCSIINGTVQNQHCAFAGIGASGIAAIIGHCFAGATPNASNYLRGAITAVSTSDITVNWSDVGTPGSDTISGQILFLA